MQMAGYRTPWKALVLMGLGLFLFSRVVGGTLALYISPRFSMLTLVAAIGLLAVGASYGTRPAGATSGLEASRDAEHGHDDHDDDDHAHGEALGHDHDHTHASNWALLLVALPAVLGLVVRPQPLGARAMNGRELGLSSLAAPRVRNTSLVSAGDRNILDWAMAFEQSGDPSNEFTDQPAHVVGFVFRDERFQTEMFMISRFVISCCTADASPVGLAVQWPAAGDLVVDQWVDVSGHFKPGKVADHELPVLVAETVKKIEPPGQPYLYP